MPVAPRSSFYGWTILIVALICYGFGISPAYYSWGIYAPDMIEDLGLDRQQVGQVFGLFGFLMSAVGPLVGAAVSRFGVRWLMAASSLLAALGFALLSRATSVADCFVAFSLLGSLGIGFSTIIPCQTLGANWFTRRRGMALSVILAAGGVVGKLSAWAAGRVLQQATWREGWLLVAVTSALLALVAAVFVRDTPESIGQHPDGDRKVRAGESTVAGVEPSWAVRDALTTWQFGALALAAVGCIVPWVVVVAHGRLHLGDLGFAAPVAAGLIGTMALMSVPGRLLTILADHVSPHWVLAGALVAEGLGITGLVIAAQPGAVRAAVVLLGLGFGASYTAISACIAEFFGRAAFPTLSGARLMVTAVFTALGPTVVGAYADYTQSYRGAFIALAALCLLSAIGASVLRPAGRPARDRSL